MTGFRQKIQTFIALSKEEKRLFFSAWWFSACVRLVTRYRPMKTWQQQWLGAPVQEINIKEKPWLPETPEIRKVRRMVDMACTYTPWKTPCLVRSILLRHYVKPYRDLPVYLGLGKNEKQHLLAHAWTPLDARRQKRQLETIKPVGAFSASVHQ
ncbi:MAG: lasso peptide biosynthesis B2 protein [Bacteroidota bacterium]